MQFHHLGYVSTDPRQQPAAGHGIDRPAELPETMDVLVVGSGPAGAIAAAQLSQFPEVCTRVIERRPHRLEIGQADGIQARSVETFQAFGFAGPVMEEGYRITEMAFWNPDPAQPENIVCTGRPQDDPHGISEFPHLIVNQARILDYFYGFAAQSPGRIVPDYGIEFVDLTVEEQGEHPVRVTLRHTAGEHQGEEFTVRTRYVIGCDGARSRVRASIGRTLSGDAANHAWGVMDVLATTDFPDIRTKCAIQSQHGSILHIPREGGHLFRMYVDLGEVPAEDNHAVRSTTIEQIIDQANQILHPYSVDVKEVAWHSVYEVGHRLTDAFDDVPVERAGQQHPRVFITGDACHTHSAKAGQGMNVSLQDGWNIAWKLGHVLTGRATEELLSTYSQERQVVAKNLIDFDKEWSTLMATRQEDLPDPGYLEQFYVKTAEFPAGFMTEYTESLVTEGTEHQDLATGFPVGKRFRSARVVRRCDANPVHLGHQATADGRWRIYVFADRPAPDAAHSAARAWADWWASEESPRQRFRREGADEADQFDVSVVYQQGLHDFRMTDVPRGFRPTVGRYGLEYWERAYAALEGEDIFQERGISREGAVVVVRPDQYVAAVLPLQDTEAVGRYFERILRGKS